MDDPANQSEAEAPEAAPPAGVGQPGANNGRSNSGAGMRWDGAIGKSRRGHLATIPVLVRWDSAATVLQALERQHDPSYASSLLAAKQHFLISVTGLLPAHLIKDMGSISQSVSNAEDASSPQTKEELLEWFMTHTQLLLKGKAPLVPVNVTIEPKDGMLQVFFKRIDVSDERKRDAFFITRYGTMNVEARFRFKDMSVNGNPDL